MAVWQVDFHLVPRKAFAGRVTLTRQTLEDTDWWRTAPFPPDYRTRLASVASPAPVEGTNPETWGSDNGNRVDVWTDRGRVVRVTARVDVRRLDSKFGAALIGFIRSAGAVLVRSDGLVVEPKIAAYAGALRNSDAWKSISGPATPSSSESDSGDDDE